MASNEKFTYKLRERPVPVPPDVPSSEDRIQVKSEPQEDYVLSDQHSAETGCFSRSETFENISKIKTEPRTDCPSTFVDTLGQNDGAGGSNEPSDERTGSDSDEDLFEEEEPAYTLRQYQKELAETALKGKNTIIFSETGSGKTLVACHIIEKHLEQTTKEPRKVVFMAPTNGLVGQHEGQLKKYLPKYSVYLISSEHEDKRLQYFYDAAQVFCLTPGLLLNNLENGYIESLSKFSLLVFDECHHAKDSPYHDLLQKYLLEKSNGQQNLPQILGLTATIGVGKSVHDIDARDYILRICAKMDVHEISMVEKHTEEFKKYSPYIEEGHISFVSQFDDNCKEVLESAIKSLINHFVDLKSKIEAPDSAYLIFDIPDPETTKFHSWTDRIILWARGIDDARDIITCAIYMDLFNSALEMNSLLNPKDVYAFLEDQYVQDYNRKDVLTIDEQKMLDIFKDVLEKLRSKKGRMQENPNLRVLSNTLKSMFEEGKGDSRAMVFVHARATCRALSSFLDSDLRDTGIPAKAMWGRQTVRQDKGMTAEEHKKLLDDFSDGNFKVLVATPVAIEGIDVANCDISISYKYTGNEIVKTQMKGRSRKDGKHITLGDEKERHKNRINVYKIAMMKRALKLVKEMPQKERDMKIRMFQEKEISDYKRQINKKEEAKRIKLDGVEFELECKRCNNFACSSFDIRRNFTSNFVVDEKFQERIIKKDHPNPKNYCGFLKKSKFVCGRCKSDWGVISEKDNKDYSVLKCEAFTIGLKGSRRKERKTYKKWSDVPFNILEY